MKQRSTTPVSKRFAARISLVAVAVLFATISSFQFISSASADSYDDRIAALQRETEQYQAQANKLNKQANTLKNALAKLAAQKSALQTRINSSELRYKQLQKQIKQTKEDIENNKQALGKTLSDIYVNGDITPIEMLASSQNISDFLNEQEYQTSIRDQLTAKINEIKKLEARLEKDKANVKKVLDDQKAQRSLLASKERERQQLLAETKGNEQAYQSLISGNKSQIQQLKQEQAAVQAAIARGNSGGSGGSASNLSGYPYYPNGCSFRDDGYGYYRCQCVSYVAYRLANDPSNSGFSRLGNANNWWNAGRSVGAGDVRRGDVIVWFQPGSYGHVMFVESVSGGTIYFTDFNGYGGPLSPGQGTYDVGVATSYPYKVIRFH